MPERVRHDGEEFAPSQERNDTPLVLIEKQRGVMRLVAVDAAAQALGLVPGLPLADARVRVPDLAVADADPAADARLLAALADACDRYTPMVALDPPDGLTLDVTGGIHVFGDEAGLRADLDARSSHWGVAVRAAFADTPEAARALARHADLPVADEAGAIRALPIAGLRLDAETVVALRRAGLRTIGDLADRPTAPLSARFGEDATAALARLTGRADSRITPRRPPPALRFERRFAEPIARTEDALAAVGALAREAAAAMDARGQGGRRFVACFFRSDGAARDLTVETSRPTRDPALVLRLLRERIDGLADPIDPGFGFDLVRLAVPVLEPLAPAQLAFDGDAARDGALIALIDRLGTRMGRGRFRRFVPADTHIPERAARALLAVEAPAPARWPVPEPGAPPVRPLHLFDPPQPIEVTAGMPDDPPRRFRWRRVNHDVIRAEGPERIAAEWWRRADNAGLTRDYYRIEDADGRRFWVFRHGLYRETDAPRWYLHGLFA